MKTITYGAINTTPELDPFTGGASTTYLKMDIDGVVTAVQEYQDNTTLSDEWHGLTLTWIVPHCLENTLLEFLNDNLELLERIHFAHFDVWNGSNMVGKLLPDGYQAVQELNQALSFLPTEYAFLSASDWLYIESVDDFGIDENTTDEQIAVIAKNITDEAKTHFDGATIILHDTEAYLTQLRDELQEEV